MRAPAPRLVGRKGRGLRNIWAYRGMKKSLAAVLAIFLALAGAAIGAMYAYDRSRDDVIAEGIKAAGVDLSGLSAAEAQAALERAVRNRSAARSRSATASTASC